MTTSSEDVLLQMGEVRYKKGDGTLYVMSERLAWMAENRDKVAVSHRYADIKMQKISPEGKQKVQLQVLLHDGNSSTFHFVNRNGQEAMLADRDQVKELLQQLLPNFKRKIDKELENKNKILNENTELLQMYKDLVITGVITSDEFWNTYAKDAMKKTANVSQETGVSSGFLANIKSQPDGCNGLKYNITADIIQSIFKTYPAVKRKHQENVPHKLSESEFWTKFFQSHYYHRDRMTQGTKDIFTECCKIDEHTFKADVEKSAGDPLLDLQQFDDVNLEEGFGGVVSDTGVVNTFHTNTVHQSMIKRFNQHSIMVLKTCTDVNQPAAGIGPVPQNSKANANGLSNGTKSNGSSDASMETAAKRQRLGEKIIFEDLGQPELEPESETEKLAAVRKKQISSIKVDRYLHGPIPISNNDTHDDVHRLDEVHQQLERFSEAALQRTQAKSVIRSSAAVNALGELSPGGALMRGFQEQSVGQLVPKDYEKDLRNLYLSLAELLKHFWNCFPPTTDEMQEKIKQMHGALQRFKTAKLESFENRATLELSPLGCSVTQDMNRLLRTANSKYISWQEMMKKKKR